jgi:hypothetical protein
MDLAESTLEDLLNTIDDVPVTYKFNGVEHTGTRGGLVMSQMNQEGGLLDEPDLIITGTLKIKDDAGHFVDAFPDEAPTATLSPKQIARGFVNEQLTDVDGISDDNYRIDRVTVDEWKNAIQFDLMSVHQEIRGRK